MMSMMFCSVSRRCWRDILGGNSSFLDSHVVYFHFLLLSYVLSLVWACGDIWSLMCQMVFSGLTTFLLPFQYGHCTFLTLHLQQLLDSLCMPARQDRLFCSPEGLHFCLPSACESVLGLANQWTSWLPSGLQPHLPLYGMMPIWKEEATLPHLSFLRSSPGALII